MEMIKFLFLIAAIVVAKPICAQNGLFKAIDEETGTTFSLAMKDEKYLLFISCQMSDDIYGSRTISYGDYEISCRNIVVIDDKNDYKMIFRKGKDDSLIIKRGLKCLEGRKFKRIDNWDDNLFDVGESFQKIQKDKTFFKTQKTLYPVNIGYYSGEGICLEFFDDGRYRYMIFDMMVSEGGYKREGNLLMLYDDGLKEPFYAIITHDGIVSCCLPGEFEGFPLKLSK